MNKMHGATTLTLCELIAYQKASVAAAEAYGDDQALPKERAILSALELLREPSLEMLFTLCGNPIILEAGDEQAARDGIAAMVEAMLTDKKPDAQT